MKASKNVDKEEICGFSESYFNIAPKNIDEYTKSKLLNLQHENMRPQRNIEINDKIPNEKYQNNKTADKTSDERDQVRKIGKKQ